MRTGIFGGTFDPVHFGHLTLAETAREFLALDRVVFVPAGIPPHKRGRRISGGADRLEMLRLATANNSAFEVCDFEILSQEVSYTAKTLEYFHKTYPGDTFFLLVGSETLADIPSWFAPKEVCRLASIATAVRPGAEEINFAPFEEIASPERIAEFRRQIIPMPLMDIASTDLRRLAACGRSVRYLTSDSVAAHLIERRLYL